jgi:hypothetical protein
VTTTYRHGVRPRIAWVIGSSAALALMVAAFTWAWFSASPWHRPVAPMLLVLMAWVAYVTGARHGASDLEPAPRSLPVVGFVGLAVATSVLVWLAGTGTLGRLRFEGTLVELEATASSMLARAPLPSYECGPAATGSAYGRLGAPDEICVSLYDSSTLGAVRSVQFAWGSRFLVYDEGAYVTPSSRCHDRLTDRWTAQAEADPGCPSAFSFSGA